MELSGSETDGAADHECVAGAAWIDKHFYEEVTLTTLAEQFYVGYSYFSRVFRQEIGESPVLYITGKRMEKAKQYI